MTCLQTLYRLSKHLLALTAILSLWVSDSLAANLTSLTAGSPSLLSQGTPDDVFNTIEGDYGVDGRILRDNIDARNGVTGGWTMNATFTPTADDLEVGRTRLIMEIGGTSNGTGLWLINGVPTLALKSSLRANPAPVMPTSLIANDLDITDNAAAIYSSFGRLTANNEVTFAASWNTADTFTVAVQDNAAQHGVIQTVRVTGASNTYNWYGNALFTEGSIPPPTMIPASLANYGGLNDTAYSIDNPLSRDNATSFVGTFNGTDTMFWNAPTTVALSAPVKPVLTLTVDRATGNVTLTNPTAAPVTVNAYTLIGGRSGFDNGGGPQGQISQSGGNLFILAADGGSQNLGDVWVRSPFSDVSAQIDVAGGDPVNVLVTYSGPEYLLADYNLNGSVGGGDWPALLAGLGTDVAVLDGVNEYLAGDITGDGLVNRPDFRRFKQLATGSGGINLNVTVPEPAGLTVALLTVVGFVVGCRRRFRAAAAVFVAAAGMISSASASDIYFINNVGEIRMFTGIGAGVGANPINGQLVTAGTLVGTVAQYGTYQDFAHVPDGRVFGVNFNGGIDVWPTIPNWLANTNSTALSANTFGPEVAVSPRSGIHGLSFDGNTGGFYAVYEGPDAIEGDLGQYPSLSSLVSNTGATVTAGAYVGNLYNFWYPGNDAPAGVIPTNPNAAPGSKYFHATGTGVLEGWTTLLTPGFGYFGVADASGGTGMGGNRSFQIAGFSGTTGIAAFADTSSFSYADMTLRVDTRTGFVTLQPGSEARTIDYLQINSAGGGLTESGYTGLGGAPGYPQGDGTANSMGWDQPPTNATSIAQKIEAFAFGSSTIPASGGEIPLGYFYDTVKDLRDLVLSYDLAADGTTLTAGGFFIEYFASVGLTGDYNNDNVVDAADYTVWRNNLGGDASSLPNRDPNNGGNISAADYQSWRNNYGAVIGSGGGGLAVVAAVPEPTTAIGFLTMILFALSFRTSLSRNN